MTRAIRNICAPRAVTLAAGALLTIIPATLLTFDGGPADAAPVARTARVPLKHSHHHERHHLRKHHRTVKRHALRVVQMTPAIASWYYDEGNTACGFHAEYGVANKTLPCGTKVMLRYGGRSVTATVDDRGPFIYGRSFDLDQRTASALGMWGVATVYSHVDSGRSRVE
jgi:rare lipoprotein A (peptidoglycan hydrolase)